VSRLHECHRQQTDDRQTDDRQTDDRQTDGRCYSNVLLIINVKFTKNKNICSLTHSLLRLTS